MNHTTFLRLSWVFAEVALCTAPCDDKVRAVRVIDPAGMKRSVRGKGSNTRYVCDILPHDDPTAAHLLVVEVMTPASHSSSYPPHKHDVEQPPVETLLEETYYHRLNPPQGFAFQRIYTDDRSIDTHVKTLRAKLRALAPHSEPIQTHRGMGYSLRDER